MARFWSGPGSDGFNLPDANTIASGPPPGTNPAVLGGRTPARWTMPFAGYSQPLLELPQNRIIRSALSYNAWLGEPIVNAASKLTIYLAFEKMILTVSSRCKEIPPWIPEDELPRYIMDYGEDKPSEIAAAYVKQKCLEALEYLDIQQFFQNEAFDILISGDGYVNIASNAIPAEEQEVWNADGKMDTVRKVEELRAKMLQDGRGPYNVYALQGLNPSAVWLYPDYAGRITHGKVVHLLGEGTWDLNLDNLIHLKAPTWNWVIYGVPHYISALKWIDIKFKFMDALFTNAQRYVSPREWLSVKGPATPEGGSLPPTEAQMTWADGILGAYMAGTPFVLPADWEFHYLGAEGKVLRVETLLEKTDDAIRTAAQVSRTFTSGAANVPAYATSKLQAGVMYKAINPLMNLTARAIEGRILQRICLMNGFFEEDGTLIAPKVEFRPLPIQGDDSVERKIQVLGAQGWLSPITAWEFEGLDPNLEMERILRAREGLGEPFRALAPDLSPSQSPDRFDEALDDIQERLNLLQNSRSNGHAKLMREVDTYLETSQSGNEVGAEASRVKLRQYLNEAKYLQQSDAQNRLDNAEDWKDQVLEQDDTLRSEDGRKRLGKLATVSVEVRNSKVVGPASGLVG